MKKTRKGTCSWTLFISTSLWHPCRKKPKTQIWTFDTWDLGVPNVFYRSLCNERCHTLQWEPEELQLWNLLALQEIHRSHAVNVVSHIPQAKQALRINPVHWIAKVFELITKGNVWNVFKWMKEREQTVIHQVSGWLSNRSQVWDQ